MRRYNPAILSCRIRFAIKMRLGRRRRDANRGSRSSSSPASTITSAASTSSRSASGRASCSSTAATRAPAPTSSAPAAPIAERHREGEELLQTGAAAFGRGDADDARRLLTSAVERGARPEEALAMLERLDRLAPAAMFGRRQSPPVATRAAASIGRRATLARAQGIRAATLLLVLAIGARAASW